MDQALGMPDRFLRPQPGVIGGVEVEGMAVHREVREVEKAVIVAAGADHGRADQTAVDGDRLQGVAR